MLNLSCLPPILSQDDPNNLHLQRQKSMAATKTHAVNFRSNYVRNIKVVLVGNKQDYLFREYNKHTQFSKFKTTSPFDNLRTDHFFHDGVMVSLEIWNCELSNTRAMKEVLEKCNVVILCFPFDHPCRRDLMQTWSTLIYLTEPTCPILLTELRSNEFQLSDRAMNRDLYAGEINAMGASDFTSVNLYNANHIQEVFQRATSLAMSQFNSSSCIMKKHTEFAKKYVKQRYSEWKMRIPAQCKLQVDKLTQYMTREQMDMFLVELDSIILSMDKLQLYTSRINMSKHLKSAKRLQAQLEQVIVLC